MPRPPVPCPARVLLPLTSLVAMVTPQVVGQCQLAIKTGYRPGRGRAGAGPGPGRGTTDCISQGFIKHVLTLGAEYSIHYLSRHFLLSE